MKKPGFQYAVILFLIALDQATKALVVKKVALYQSIPIIPGFFNITRIHNKGAIFGMFSQSGGRLVTGLLTGASLLALGFVAFYFLKTPASERLMKFSLTLILAGALGNLTDRVLRGQVVDFLDFYISRHHWPFFNVADSCISVGACLLIILILFPRRPPCTPSS